MAKDPYRYFRIEASELLEQLTKTVLDLEKGAASAEPVLRLLRLAHTLKGAARVVRQAEIADLAHGIEDALAVHRDGTTALPRQRIDSLLNALDAIGVKIAQLPQADNGQSHPAAPEALVRMVRADVAEVDILLQGLVEIGSELSGLKHGLAAIERARNQARQPHKLSAAQLQAKMADMLASLDTVERTMMAGVERIERELHQARDTSERLRLVPVSGVFNALERTVRDAAHRSGKQVVFDVIGGDLRIDGEVLDTVQNALIQLVRNAVAHGIETEVQRTMAGKPAAGRLTLEISRRASRIWIRCHDDGAGIDLEALRRVLKKTDGRYADTQGLDAQALLALLLKGGMGGISTSSVVTELSGRGVGLDVVRDAMQRLNGEIYAHTEQGCGTSVELSVPLSLAALEVLMIMSNGEPLALPLDAVRHTMRVLPEDIFRTPMGEAIVYQGKQIPLAHLQLGTRADKTKGKGPRASAAMTAIVMAATDHIAAIAVDRLQGIEMIVLRPLPKLAPADPIVMGIHLDDEGNPRIVLDPEQIVMRQYHAAAEAATPVMQQAPLRPILVIDDSLTTRMLECSILESAGFTVETAASAEEGLDMAFRNTYALFLVDVEMPGMDGFGFVARTRSEAALCDIPCILVTSRNAPEDRQRGNDCGAADYIVKGEFDQVDFLQRISHLVQR